MTSDLNSHLLLPSRLTPPTVPTRSYTNTDKKDRNFSLYRPSCQAGLSCPLTPLQGKTGGAWSVENPSRNRLRSWAGAAGGLQPPPSFLQAQGPVSGDLPGRTEAVVCSRLWSVSLAWVPSQRTASQPDSGAWVFFHLPTPGLPLTSLSCTASYISGLVLKADEDSSKHKCKAAHSFSDFRGQV